MDIIKNTSLITGLYLGAAILVIVLGVWREHLYHEKSGKQQEESNSRQTKINEQQDEITGLLHQIIEQKVGNSANSSEIAKSVIERMKKEGILSESTAKVMAARFEGKVGAVAGGSAEVKFHHAPKDDSK